MKHLRQALAAIALVFISYQTLASTQPYCDFKTVTFSKHFAGAKLDACTQLSERHFLLTTTPENEPINPSPWYAFAVSSKGQDHTITLTIAAQNARARYMPKASVDKQNWRMLPFSVENDRLTFSLQVSEQTTYISAQHLITAKNYAMWTQNIAKESLFVMQRLGESVEKRPIDALVHNNPKNQEWLVLIGRQHPPELTGAMAFKAFLQAMLKHAHWSDFAERFNILAVPLANPDGVEKGHWRHNANGIDLNRDWGKFTQPETKHIHAAMLNLMADTGRLVFALDFHSTQQDIFYTMPNDYGVVPAQFAIEWLGDVKKAQLRSFTVRERPGSSPGRGVFKQFIADTYGVHAVTYEMGDNTPPALVNHIAQVSAGALINKMLATPAQAFVVPAPREQ